MKAKKFSQKNLTNALQCDGCDAQCSIEYRVAYYGYYPAIGGEVIDSYKSNEVGKTEPISTLCQRPNQAITLAKKIVKLCDFYKQR